MIRALAFLACAIRFVAESVDPSARVEGLQAASIQYFGTRRA